jgi:hypothetical protein
VRHSNLTANVADGSKAVILKVGNDFRSSPNNGQVTTASACPFRANNGSEAQPTSALVP